MRPTSSWPDLIRPSPCFRIKVIGNNDVGGCHVDARVKHGHDGEKVAPYPLNEPVHQPDPILFPAGSGLRSEPAGPRRAPGRGLNDAEYAFRRNATARPLERPGGYLGAYPFR